MRSHQRVFLQHFKLSFCCFLASTLSDEKPAVILLIVFLCVIYPFLWLLLRFCFFIFVYQQLHYVSRCDFLCIYDAGGSLISLDLRIPGCCIFLQIWKTFGQYFFKSFFMPHSLSSSVTTLTLILDFLLLSTGHSRLCSFFFQIFFVSVLQFG